VRAASEESPVARRDSIGTFAARHRDGLYQRDDSQTAGLDTMEK
jgi:hypothetical protein